MGSCKNCSAYILEKSIKSESETTESTENEVILDDTRALERVRELELELAQTKLAHVEAECRNQVSCFYDISSHSYIFCFSFFFT